MNQRTDTADRILSVERLQVHFTTLDGRARAVDEVGFDVRRRETLGVVGESGCGKSVTALSIMRLLPTPPAQFAGGRILFDSGNGSNGAVDLLKLPRREMCALRGNQVSMIFQEPMTSLNPVFTIGSQVEEVLRKHRRLHRSDAKLEALRMLERVRIPDAGRRYDEYPHQLSGGMRQRVMIAMALVCDPLLLLADEPTTALDVTVQAQILALIDNLKQERQSAIVLITHDLGVIAGVADRVVVMYAGEVVEEQPTAALFEMPLHPYTQCLMRSIPARQARRQKLYVIPGNVPNPADYPTGCRFAPRCPSRFHLCDSHPPLATRPDGAKVRCFLYEECIPEKEPAAQAPQD